MLASGRRARSSAAGAAGLIALLLSAACARQSAAPPAEPPAPVEPLATPDECALLAGPPQERDSLIVALVEPVLSTDAPLPRNDSERLVFRQSWEPPVELDCRGRPRPGLAASWSRDSSGHTWTLVLRDSLTADSGAAVTAADLAGRWRASDLATAALRWAGVEQLVALDPRRLAVTFRTASPGIPTSLADPALALPQPAHQRPALVFRPAGADPRDALDRWADLLETSDPVLLEYAGRRAEFATLPLPWSRTYVLVAPAGQLALQVMSGSDSSGFRAALARDVVRVESRAAEPPFWWSSVVGCDSSARPAETSTAPSGGAIVYPSGDPVARDLAERMVALAGDRTLLARSVAPSELSTRLRNGSDRAYLLALPRNALVPCRDLAELPPGATILPLVDTRSSAVVRRGSPPLTVEWDGAIRP
jgi:hypothetical protein